MSTSAPIASPSIPWPNEDTTSIMQSTIALKQNVEILQGTRGVVDAAKLHGPTETQTLINATLRALS